jgi:hypothetical protein
LNAKVEVPTWLALGNYSSLKKGLADAKAACKVAAFGDQVPKMVQFVTKRSGQKYDHNLLCVQSAGLVLTN